MRLRTSVTLLTLAASSLAAQDPPSDTKRTRTLGLGVQLNPTAMFIDDDFGVVPSGLSNFLVPIRVTPRTTIEPEIGFTRFSASAPGGGGAPASESSFSNTRIGVGILGAMGSDGPLSPYFGVRVVRLTVSLETRSGTFSSSSETTGWTMAGVVGGQHFFTDAFSLGGEIQLARTAFGEPETTGGGGFPGEKQTFTGTNGIVTIRWFP